MLPNIPSDCGTLVFEYKSKKGKVDKEKTASTTQNEQLQDNTIMNNDLDGSLQQHIQKTPHNTKQKQTNKT